MSFLQRKNRFELFYKLLNTKNGIIQLFLFTFAFKIDVVLIIDNMNIAIVGSGYVGLVTGACFAEIGVNVVCVDFKEAKIEMLNEVEIPIYEPGFK